VRESENTNRLVTRLKIWADDVEIIRDDLKAGYSISHRKVEVSTLGGPQLISVLHQEGPPIFRSRAGEMKPILGDSKPP